jgi:peptide subunit release factor RF-3
MEYHHLDISGDREFEDDTFEVFESLEEVAHFIRLKKYDKHFKITSLKGLKDITEDENLEIAKFIAKENERVAEAKRIREEKQKEEDEIRKQEGKELRKQMYLSLKAEFENDIFGDKLR